MNFVPAIGRNLPRAEAAEKATGAARFTDDLKLSGMLHGAILQSPLPHAKILRYDIAKALALPGVRAVITGADFQTRYMGLVVKDETVLAKDRVRYIGEPVAAVAAVDLETAKRAVRLIEVEYEELPAVFSIEEAMAPDAPLLHPDFADYFKIYEWCGKGNVLADSKITEGDVNAGFEKCDVVVEGVYETAAQYHAYLEPASALAAVEQGGKVTVWSSTQSVFRTQANIHESLGIPMSKIRCVAPRIGGGFGGKSEAMVQPIAVALAQRTGKPVKITLSRDEDMIMMRSRHPSRTVIRTGATKDGKLLARDVQIWMDGGAYADDSPAVMNFALFFAKGPYRIPNFSARGYAIYTNKLRAGAFRGFGNPQATFAGELQIDEIAEKLGMDPIDLRIQNAVEKGDRWVGGQEIQSCILKECLETARDRSGWTKRREDYATNKVPNKRRGIGVAACAHISGFLATSAIVRLLEDGSVTLNTGAVDIGQGSDTALTQMCAGALAIDVEQVNFVAPDTDAAPYNSGTNASRVTYMVGRAVHQAAEVVREKIFKHASELLEADPQDLVLQPGGRVSITGIAEKFVTFQQVAARSIWIDGGPIIGTGSVMFNDPLDPKYALLKGFVSFDNVGAFTFGAHVVDVEIDDATGKTEVKGAWCVHDVGKAINPTAVEGQIQGGFVQGAGYALTEEMIWDGGRLGNPSFMDYKVPGSLDIPYEIESILLEDPEPTHPFGAKGIGEPPLIAASAAIGNAVSHAVGAPCRTIPLTPERVLDALDKTS